MVKKSKRIIITLKGKENIIGPIVITAIAFGPRFSNQFKLRVPQKINKVMAARLASGIEKAAERVAINFITDTFTDSTINEKICDTINRIPLFWEYDIYVPADISNLENSFNQKLKKKLIEQNTIINYGGQSTRFTKLGEAFCTHNFIKKLDSIKQVWADFGTGKISDPLTLQFIKNYPECIWIRST